jgi:hypothetical protein
VFKTILLIESDEVLKDFFARVFFIDGFEVLYLEEQKLIQTLSKKTINDIDMVLIDDCDDPEAFSTELKDLMKTQSRTRNLPVLGVLKKGADPELSHKYFDAVMIKDNFNIQLLTDLVERIINP